MSEHDDGLDTSFKSVRKNLNILAILMIVLATSKAKIDSLGFLGLSISLDESRFYFLIWIGLAYFILRYFHYLDIKKFNSELVIWNWSYFNRKSKATIKSAKMIKLYKKKYLGDKSIDSNELIVTDLQLENGFPFRRINVFYQSSIHELKVPTHLFVGTIELLIQQLWFAFRTRWFFTLYLPILLVILLFLSISLNVEWPGNPLNIIKEFSCG